MRISQQEIEYFYNKIKSIDADAKIYLFGSRASDDKRGGDIDILILTNNKLSFEEKAAIRYGFMQQFGEQKIDLVNYTFKERNSFKNIALGNSIEIS